MMYSYDLIDAINRIYADGPKRIDISDGSVLVFDILYHVLIASDSALHYEDAMLETIFIHKDAETELKPFYSREEFKYIVLVSASQLPKDLGYIIAKKVSLNSIFPSANYMSRHLKSPSSGVRTAADSRRAATPSALSLTALSIAADRSDCVAEIASSAPGGALLRISATGRRDPASPVIPFADNASSDTSTPAEASPAASIISVGGVIMDLVEGASTPSTSEERTTTGATAHSIDPSTGRS